MLVVYSLTGYAAKLLVLGDSLSASYGFEPQLSWVNLLQQRLQALGYPHQVINASITGSTSSQGLTRLPQLLEKHQPAVVIVELGGNDGLRGIPVSELQNNLLQIVQQSKSQNAKILLLGVRLPPNYGPIYAKRFEAVYQAVAKQQQIDLVPYFLAGVDDKPEFMQQDNIHPRATAQSLLLENIWPQLKPLLLKENIP